MAKLTTEEVIQCRIWYREGKRSHNIWEEYFSDKINYNGFQKMWCGKTWKHIMPEVFNNNPHPRQKITPEIAEQIRDMYNN